MASSNLLESLKDSGPGSGQSRKQERIRSILVASEVALACMLLVGAGLLLRSFLNVLNVDLGFQPERAYAIKVDYHDAAIGEGNPSPQARQAIIQRRTAFYQQVLSRVGAIPGVEGAGISDYLPLGGNRSWGTPFPKGVTPPDKLPAGPLVYVTTPGYLHAMGTQVRGRDFTWDDGSQTQNVVIINDSFARFLASFAHWPNNDALGQVIANGSADLHIIGIAADVHEENTEGEAGWQIYYPQTQAFPSGAQLVVRSSLPASALASGVLQTLRNLNPGQTAAEFRPMQTFVDHSNSPRRFFMLLVASFAALGLFLASLGIYGVISYSVTQRTQEIGVRMALGATQGQVQLSVIGKTMRLTLMGIAVGTIASLAVAKSIAALLFSTAPTDPITFASMIFLLTSVALLAGYLPARRASRINPMIALRND
jgi:predicted permease